MMRGFREKGRNGKKKRRGIKGKKGRKGYEIQRNNSDGRSILTSYFFIPTPPVCRDGRLDGADVSRWHGRYRRKAHASFLRIARERARHAQSARETRHRGQARHRTSRRDRGDG